MFEISGKSQAIIQEGNNNALRLLLNKIGVLQSKMGKLDSQIDVLKGEMGELNFQIGDLVDLAKLFWLMADAKDKREWDYAYAQILIFHECDGGIFQKNLQDALGIKSGAAMSRFVKVLTEPATLGLEVLKAGGVNIIEAIDEDFE